MPIDYTRRDRRPGGVTPAAESPEPTPAQATYTEPGPTPMPPPSNWLDIIHDAPQATLERLKPVINRLGLRDLELQPAPFGVGLAVGFGDTGFTVVSVAGGGNEGHVSLSCGVLRDVRQDRLLVLDACNRLTRDRAAYPFFLHDAQVGWDVLLQTSFPAQVLHDAPAFLDAMLRGLPQVAQEGREQLLDSQVGGVAYEWAPADLQRLLIRSQM